MGFGGDIRPLICDINWYMPPSRLPRVRRSQGPGQQRWESSLRKTTTDVCGIRIRIRSIQLEDDGVEAKCRPDRVQVSVARCAAPRDVREQACAKPPPPQRIGHRIRIRIRIINHSKSQVQFHHIKTDQFTDFKSQISRQMSKDSKPKSRDKRQSQSRSFPNALSSPTEATCESI